MKRRRAFWGLCVGSALVVMIFLACGGSTKSNVDNLSTRVNLLFAGSASLAPVGSEGVEYTLTLENVSKQVLWYADRPSRGSGTEDTQTYVSSWSDGYGEIAPNAVLDGYIAGSTSNDGLFLMMGNPSYDSGANRLTFPVTLLDATVANLESSGGLLMDQVKVTVLDNSAKDDTDDWSFAQVSPKAFFETTETEGLYKLHLERVYPESYYIGNAPNRRSYMYTLKTFIRNWLDLFQNDPPNASMTSYTEDGVLKVHMLTIDDPEYDQVTGSVVYSAKLLHGAIEARQPLLSPTLFVDKVKAADVGTHTIQVQNNCTETIWLGACGNCTTQDSPCPQFFDPPKGANVEMDAGTHIVFHVAQGWGGRFWPRTGCSFNDDGLCDSGDCCDAGGCVNEDHEFAKACYYSGNPPVLVIEPTFDAPTPNGPLDYFDTSMVDGYNVLMSIAAIKKTYNTTPDPGMNSEYWCTLAGCSSSPVCPGFLDGRQGKLLEPLSVRRA